MATLLRTAAVLGAGTMGAQIAAHLANAGLTVTIYDLTSELAAAGLDRLKSIRPDPFFTPDVARRVRPAGFDRLADLAAADWILEAVVERLEVKRDLWSRVEPHAAPHVILSSNTSGIPLADIAAGRSPGFQRRWLGTHFFNPPRYLPLVELIPIDRTDPRITTDLTTFLDHRLGKSIVMARDTPGFIANRLGIFGALRAIDAVASGAFTIEEVDALTGSLIGRPKSATFRTIDLAGLDILVNVADDLARRLDGRDDAPHFHVPEAIRRMVSLGLLGAKTGRGFYRRDENGAILTLDLSSLDGDDPRYRPYEPARLPGLDAAQSESDLGERLRRLAAADRTGDLVRAAVGLTLMYAVGVAPEIAESIDDVDRAMRWGYGWTLGPFETLDAIGGRSRFREGALPSAGEGLLILGTSRQQRGVVKRNAGASLVDLGDGVLALELHSKMNTLGGDAIAMIDAGIREASANFEALVVGSETELFSAGANLTLLLIEAQEGNWDEVDLMVRSFQRATMALRTSPVPVVAAPAGLALGGGCEICLHCDRVQAAAETYMGLVEAGVGLIPAGGGTKEMLLRAIHRAGPGPIEPHVRAAFEAMAFAKVSTSAADARRLGYLRDQDGVTMNRERLIAEAKAVARLRASDGYQPPIPRDAVPVGGADLFATLSLGVHLAERAGRASAHDAKVARKLAWVLTGGDLPHRATVTEAWLLDLEREAFLSLCGEAKTLERIGYTLKTGKTLRN